MARGPIIPDTIKHQIIKLHRDKPNLYAKNIQKTINDSLREKRSEISEGWPSVSAVQKILAGVHKEEGKQSPDAEDCLWTVTDIVQYPIPPEALPTVLRVWAEAGNNPLTIRQVLWVARLYYVFKESFKGSLIDDTIPNDVLPLLTETAKDYASLEKAAKSSTKITELTWDNISSWGLFGHDTLLDLIKQGDEWRSAKKESMRSPIDKMKKKRQESSGEKREVENEGLHSQ